MLRVSERKCVLFFHVYRSLPPLRPSVFSRSESLGLILQLSLDPKPWKWTCLQSE